MISNVSIYTEEDDDESWSDENSWNWGVEFNESHGSKDTKCLDWMNSCLITVSPHCEMLIIAHEDRYVVMTCNSHFSTYQFIILNKTSILFYLQFQ